MSLHAILSGLFSGGGGGSQPLLTGAQTFGGPDLSRFVGAETVVSNKPPGIFDGINFEDAAAVLSGLGEGQQTPAIAPLAAAPSNLLRGGAVQPLNLPEINPVSLRGRR